MVYLSAIKMITEENRLHDTGLIREVVLALFGELKSKYEFLDSNENSVDNHESISIGIEKGEVIVYVLISKREGYEINVLKKGNSKWKARNWSSFFFEKFSPLSSESKKYLNENKGTIDGVARYSYEWYFNQALNEIRFLEEYYPEIFLNGVI